ncbi:MAG TPA: nitroreductase family protein [Dehalococcoidia bacterium]|nr:nitroreductase family protein [Dehalococcoidia bacterium]
MDAYTCIISKRDTRSYADKPIAPEVLRRILQAGRMAGSAKNTQHWRFVLLEERARKQELAACGQYAAHIPWAAVVVAIVMPEQGRDFDAGRCAQNMMLAAHADGITSCPVSMHDQECARRVLGLPEGHRVPIVLAFGYPPAAARAPGVPRTPLDDLVHRGGW